ncbi:neck protein [Synechococcus phage S-B43]|jgi:hypothetical protein|nr:neck protein [Synechococcus phage S-B43]AYR01734.1 neck protein [Synechococcus phage S-B05]QCW22826.1 neck protein [Synechococcus phage S-B05]QDH50491.1 neck protein [Synechococcus phage S-B43]
MAQPSTRQELIDYCLRQLGAPVLEINVADEQIEDLVDDAIQYFQERHFDGVTKVYLKYELTEEDIKRGRARPPGAPQNENGTTGITSITASASVAGTATTFTYYQNSNYIQIPPSIIGVNKIYQYPAGMGAGMFNVRYQYMLNDFIGLNGWGAGGFDLLSYSMTMGYLETINFILNTHKQIRFNQRTDRLYIDVDYSDLNAGEFLILDCWAMNDPNDYARIYNDSFIKPYLTALIKRQWGQNLIKFQGVKLPGGIEFNGRQLYDDAQAELDRIQERMMSTYELPPLDMIG